MCVRVWCSMCVTLLRTHPHMHTRIVCSPWCKWEGDRFLYHSRYAQPNPLPAREEREGDHATQFECFIPNELVSLCVHVQWWVGVGMGVCECEYGWVGLCVWMWRTTVQNTQERSNRYIK